MAEKDKDNKELKTALAAIEKEFGKGVDHVAGRHERAGRGGHLDRLAEPGHRPRRQGAFRAAGSIEIYGAEASGKTTIALHAVAQAQKAGGVAAYHRRRARPRPELGQAASAWTSKRCSSASRATARKALRIAEMLVKSNAVDIIVIDSVAALVPKNEIQDSEIGDTKVGLQARLMSQALRILNPTINKSRTCMVFINQIRQKIGVMYGDPKTTTGGLALKFYASRADGGEAGHARQGRRRDDRRRDRACGW